MTVNKNWNCATIFNCDNLNTHEALFEKAKKEGMESVALLDDGKMQHIFMTSETAKQYDLKVFVGCKFPFKIGSNVVTLALYPRNNKGMKFLEALSTEFLEKGEKELRLEGKKESLSQMNIVVDATEEISPKAVREVLITLFNITSKGFIHVGVSDNFYGSNKEKNLLLKEIIKKEGVGYIPFNKVLFLEEEDYENFYSLNRIKEKEMSEDVEHIFMSSEEVESVFSYMEGAQDNSEKIFNNTNVDVIIGKRDMKIPDFDIVENFTVHPLFKTRFDEYIQKSSKVQVKSAAYLFHLVMDGVIERYGKQKNAIERALSELKVIIEKDFSNYFLIVWDLIKYAKSNGIVIGPGRGSAVSSVASYSLGITEIDPLKWNLQFERFLNIFRLDFPDIDIDVSQRHREKLITYLKKKYGEAFVAQIVTRSNYGFKNIVNNLVKVMKVPNDKVKKLKEMHPENHANLESFTKTLTNEEKEFLRSSKDVRVLLERGFALREIPQGTSRHASGVLISSVPLRKEMPMMFDENGMLTQVPNDNDTNSLEKMGFLKYDILGLRTLDVVEDTKTLIEIKEGQVFPEIPYNDEKTLKMLSDGYTEGVFQLESASRFAKQIKIDDFKDIVALNALNRPGPMDNIPLFSERKGQPIKVFGRNKKELSGVESLYPLLEETNGIVVYQEQINELVKEWAGYSLGEAELFRKAISKKQADVLKNQREEFLKKAKSKGRDEQTTSQLYELIMEFANYGFNKAHAVAYSWISYMCAYLKTHYTAEYMVSLMNSVASNAKKVSPYIEESRRMNVEILRPDINVSTNKFQVVEGNILCALQLVSNIGEKTAKSIVRVRGNQPFRNLKDVLSRTFKTDVSVSNIETLIRAGALDSLGDRELLLHELGGFKELEVMGIVEKIKEEIRLCGTIFLLDSSLKRKLMEKSSENANGITGIITNLKKTQDKYKRDMAKLQLLDFEGRIHYLVVFNRVWKEVETSLYEGAIVIGELDNRAFTKVKAFQL